MLPRPTRACLCLLWLAGLFLPVAAAPPEKISFQGRLTDSSGNPVNGPVTMTFRLYDSPTSPTSLWEETQSVTIDNGLYSVLLGVTSPLSVLDFNAPYWLGLTIGSDAEMAPRFELAASPYAFRAAAANRLVGEARFLELPVNGAHYVGFRGPEGIAANLLWILPATDGTGARSWPRMGREGCPGPRPPADP